MKQAGVIFISFLGFLVLVESGSQKHTDENSGSSTLDEGNGRLPVTLIPYHYNLMVRPMIILASPPFPFIGQVDIHFECTSGTNVITINSKDLTIDQSTVQISTNPDTPGTPPSPIFDRMESNPSAEFLYFYTTNNFVENERYILSMNFSGYLREAGQEGFYWDSYYGPDSRIRYLAATLLEPISARAVFPCFDEVDMKATFNITIQHAPYHLAFSNMPIIQTVNRDDGWVADTFAQTPVMTPFLVSLVLGEFSCLTGETDEGLELSTRVCATSESIGFMEFAAKEVVARTQNWLSVETNIPYMLPKTDHVAIPNIYGKATWGLITFGEEFISINPETSAISGRINCAGMIAHSLAHQWYGHLVTMKWFDDVWLSEGFATYYQYFAMEALGWETSELQQVEEYFGIHNTQIADQLNISDPIRKYEISTIWNSVYGYAGSTYPKGAAILRMLKGILTKPVLDRALTKYLQRYQYSSATTDNLWAIFSEQAAEDGITNPDGSALDVKSRMDPWLNQMGFPLVTVTGNGDGTAVASRTRFLGPLDQDQDFVSPWNYRWDVPITMATADSDGSDVLPIAWIDIDKESATISVPTGVNNWYIINPGQTMFYRVLYDPANRAAVINQLLSDHTLIDSESRSQFIDDAFVTSRAGLLPATEAMETIRYVSKDLAYNPWYSVFTHLSFNEKLFRTQPWYSDFKSYYVGQMDPLVTELGWVFDSQETPLTHCLRRDILSAACTLGHAACLDTARSQYATYKVQPDINSVDPNVLPVVLCIGTMEGTENDWQMSFDQYVARKTSQIREERYAYLTALTCTNNTQLLDRLLNEIIFGANINTKDLNQVTHALAANPYGADKIWDFLDTYWSNVPNSIDKYSVVLSIAAGFTTTEELNKLNDFIDRRQPITESERNIFAQGVINVEENIEWLINNARTLGEWFQANQPTKVAVGVDTVKPEFNSHAASAIYRMPTTILQHWRMVDKSYGQYSDPVFA